MSSERRRDMLLDVTLEVAVAEGFHAATIERVAREAGVTRTLLYSQFGDLAGMVSALVDRETAIAMQGLGEALAPMPEQMDLVDVSEALLRAMVHAVGLAPRSWQILLNPPEGGPPELHERIAAGRALARAHVQQLLTGRLPAQLGDPELTAHLHHLAGEELVRLHLRDPETFPLDRMIRQVRQIAAGTLAAQRKESAR
ncbi:MAG TPA: helix-turn-helix domain-containing protein [Sporichthyaceae bacterium]|jgi:AcrR family transcriptional regulator|nr:helix-turn-helix domain-containing protein [Sporichthyaceae bacterium]